MEINKTEIQKIIDRALTEDIGGGDVTTNATIPETEIYEGVFLAKSDGIVAGLSVAAMVFSTLDKNSKFTRFFAEGDGFKTGDILAKIEGNGRALLTGERTALNFLQRLSGIATATAKYVEAVKPYKAKILDTRKTVPGLRMLDKYAVGLAGENHRIGLFDMVLIKDNHIVAAGGITEAVNRVRKHDTKHVPIEVEVKNLEELREALALKPDRILLDNMDTGQMKEAVEITAGKVPLEASGGVNLETVNAIAATGVNYISVGALTHSVKAMDISLELTTKGGKT